MTRFSADDPEARRDLFTDAVAAHRTRESPFCTIETEGGGPWIQIGVVREEDATGQPGTSVLNLDCTDEELDRLEALLNEFSDFSIDDLTRPENAEGTNVRIGTFADAERIGEFTERSFQTVYKQPENVVVWATEI